MDWLAKLVSSLPLDSISDMLSHVTNWWGRLVADVPPDMLPLYAYVGFSVLVLLLWLLVVRVLPRPLGGMSWLFAFAVLFAPTMASSNTGDVAPASIVVIYALLMKDPTLAFYNLLPILVVFAVGLFLGFIWQTIKNILEVNAEKSRRQAIADERANMQLAGGDYIYGDYSHTVDDLDTPEPVLIKTKKEDP